MVGPGFETGAVVLPLRARLEALQSGLRQGQQELEKFGQGVQQTAERVKQSATGMQRSIVDTGEATGKFAQKLGNGVQRLLALQLVMQQFGSKAGAGEFGKEIKAAGDGLATFTAILSVFPNKAGLIVGALAGIGVAIGNLTGPSEEAKKKIEELQATLQKYDETARQIFQNRTRALIESDVDAIVRRGLGTPTVTAAGRSEEAERSLAREAKHLADLIQQYQALKSALQGGTNLSKEQLKTFQDLETQIPALSKSLEELATRVKGAREAAGVQAEFDDFNKSMDELDKTARVLEESFKLGLVTPAENLNEELRIAQERLKLVLRLSEQNRGKIPIAEEVFKEGFQSLQIEIDRQSAEDALREIHDEQVRLDEIAADKAAQARLDAAKATRQDFADAFSIPVSQAIGDAVYSGILRGADAMEIVADIGKGLFSNFLRQAIDGFQVGMVKAFDAIAGAGGAALGGLFSALVGIAGFFLAESQRKDDQETFADVDTGIESSQAVRGIVSGPTNVAIAAVGENLERALSPTRAVLVEMLLELQKIRVNTGGFGAGGGNAPFAGSVATP